VWCQPCASRIRRALGGLDYLGCLLAAIADGHHEQPLNPQRVGAYAASPSSAADDLDELQRILIEWEAAYYDHRKWVHQPRHGYLASVPSEVISWLTGHLDGVLASPFAAEFGSEVLQWHRDLMSKAKAGTGVHKKPVNCPWCGLKTLTWREDDEYVACANPGCRCRLSMDQYREEAAQAARRLERAG
jgi:hypothetical protein